jgi:PleD family two-component response regulator
MSSSGDLVARADEAMYAAKRGGRNRVCKDEAG